MGSLSDLIKNNKVEPVKKEENKIIHISQSIIKRLYDKNQEPILHCPLELYECDIKHNFDFPTSYMIKGMFGETLLLGSCAKGKKVEDLEKHKKTHLPLKDEVNIRQQITEANKFIIANQINIIPHYNTQVPVICKVEENVYLVTELDCFPTIIWVKDGLKLCALDLKMSSDINSTWGEYAWRKNFEYMDHCQPDSIYWLMDHIDIDLCKKTYPEFETKVGYDNIFTQQVINNLHKLVFIYFVIGYDKVDIKDMELFRRCKHDVNEKGEEMLTNHNRQRDFYERMRKSIELLKVYYDRGFLPIPYNDVDRKRGCHKCHCNVMNKSELNPKAFCEEGNKIRSC